MGSSVELPPSPLRNPVSVVASADRAAYLARGAAVRGAIEAALPASWSWRGKRVLDFGCGSCRVLRHFLEEARAAEFWGTDIDAACIEWNQAHLDPPISFLRNEELPPLAFAEGTFDLVYAMSVFTHLSAHWAGWLLEMHRILAPDGLLIATFMGEGMSEAVAGQRWRDADVGMNVYEEGQSWARGGPMVLHSPWWIRAHWGRLFEVERLAPSGFVREVVNGHTQDHGVVVARKTDKLCTFEELESVEPDEPREATALLHEVHHLRAEVAGLRRELEMTSKQPADGH